MATRKRKTEREDKGEGNGEGNGESKRSALEFFAFLDVVKAHEGELLPSAWVSASDPEGRTIGSSLGKLDLQPLETLDDRIDATWPGPRSVVLRTRFRANGRYADTGHKDIPPSKPAAAPVSANDAALAAVIEQNKKQAEELRELRELLMKQASAPKVDRTEEEVTGLERLARVFVSMQPKQPEPQPAPKVLTLREQLTELRDARELLKEVAGSAGGAVAAGASFGEVLVKECKDGINDILRGTAGLLAVKAGFVEGEKK